MSVTIQKAGYAQEYLLVAKEAENYFDSPKKSFVVDLVYHCIENRIWRQIALYNNPLLMKVQTILQWHGTKLYIQPWWHANKALVIKSLMRYGDRRWSELYSSQQIQQMIKEDLERSAFSIPKINQILRKHLKNIHFRNDLIANLGSHELAVITAAVLTEIPSDLGKERSHMAHAELVRIFSQMIKNNKSMTVALLNSNAKVVIIPMDQTLQDIFTKRFGNHTFHPKTRGMYCLQDKTAFVGEEGLIGKLQDGEVSQWPGQSMATHELAHLIHCLGLSEFHKVSLEIQYQAIRYSVMCGQGNWFFSPIGKYAESNPFECFAEFACYFFEANGHPNYDRFTYIGTHTAPNLPTEVRKLYYLFLEIFGGNNTKIHFTNPLPETLFGSTHWGGIFK